MSAALLREMRRMFAHTFDGRIVVCDNCTTNPTRTTLAKLHALTRKGWIDYEEEPGFKRVFGVTGWKCTLTAKGRAALEETLRAEEATR